MAITIPTSGMDTSDATAQAADILQGKTAYVDGDKITGTIPSKAAQTYTPGTSSQTIAAGQYLSGAQTISGSSNLVAANIKTGKSIFGVAGTFTADATAAAADMLSGKTAYVNGSKVTGNIPSKAATNYTPGTADQTIAAGQYLSGAQTVKGDVNLVSGNIKAGTTIFGVSGSSSVVDTSDATVTATTLRTGYTAYKNGSKITGTVTTQTTKTWTPTTADQTISSPKFITGTQTIKGDANLVSANIKAGISIFGVEGSSAVVDTADADAVAEKIFNGVTAYVNGTKVTGTALATASTATAARIRSGYKAYDSNGNLITGTGYATTTTATAADILSGKKAYTNTGTLLTGTAYDVGGTVTREETVGSGMDKAIGVTPTALSQTKEKLAAVSIGSYALFAGGYLGSVSAVVNAYNASLTRSTPTALSQARCYAAAAKVGNYALFMGGSYGSTGTQTSSNVVDAYNASLTRTTPTVLSQARHIGAGVSVGSYALIGGGFISGTGYCNVVDAYNESLTRSVPTVLSQARYFLAAATVGSYGIFAGGFGDTYYSNVDAYNTSLTRSIPSALSEGRTDLAGASVGNYALFGGGNYADCSSRVDAYNASLSRSIPTALSVARNNLAATAVGGYALFAGGGVQSSAKVDAYDASLVRTTPDDLSQAREMLAATAVDKYALFAGGYGGGYSSAVDAYSKYNLKAIYVKQAA